MTRSFATANGRCRPSRSDAAERVIYMGARGVGCPKRCGAPCREPRGVALPGLARSAEWHHPMLADWAWEAVLDGLRIA